MGKVEPLNPTEEAIWRSLMLILRQLPRLLENDLWRATGLTSSEYTTIMNLSEAPEGELRMADLADAAGLSPSRTTRLIDDLETRGLVRRETSATDRRSNVAKLTPEGMAVLRSAWPTHLESVRRRVFDHIDRAALLPTSEALVAVALSLVEEGGATPADQRIEATVPAPARSRQRK